MRPSRSTCFILPVKNGWQALQISTFIPGSVLRVTNELPQPHVTLVSTYLGCIPSFMTNSTVFTGNVESSRKYRLRTDLENGKCERVILQIRRFAGKCPWKPAATVLSLNTAEFNRIPVRASTNAGKRQLNSPHVDCSLESAFLFLAKRSATIVSTNNWDM